MELNRKTWSCFAAKASECAGVEKSDIPLCISSSFWLGCHGDSDTHALIYIFLFFLSQDRLWQLMLKHFQPALLFVSFFFFFFACLFFISSSHNSSHLPSFFYDHPFLGVLIDFQGEWNVVSSLSAHFLFHAGLFFFSLLSNAPTTLSLWFSLQLWLLIMCLTWSLLACHPSPSLQSVALWRSISVCCVQIHCVENFCLLCVSHAFKGNLIFWDCGSWDNWTFT